MFQWLEQLEKLRPEFRKPVSPATYRTETNPFFNQLINQSINLYKQPINQSKINSTNQSIIIQSIENFEIWIFLKIIFDEVCYLLTSINAPETTPVSYPNRNPPIAARP